MAEYRSVLSHYHFSIYYSMAKVGRWVIGSLKTASPLFGWKREDRNCIAQRPNDLMTQQSPASSNDQFKSSEEELVEVAAVVLAVVGELAAEMAVMVAELSVRIEALETTAKH